MTPMGVRRIGAARRRLLAKIASYPRMVEAIDIDPPLCEPGSITFVPYDEPPRFSFVQLTPRWRPLLGSVA